MKDSHSNDPVDTTIDTLLSIQPLKAPQDLPERVLAAAQKPNELNEPKAYTSTARKPYAYALATAAALALSLILWFGIQTPQAVPELSFEQTQEILRMEASLSALTPTLDENEFNTRGLLATFETASFTF